VIFNEQNPHAPPPETNAARATNRGLHPWDAAEGYGTARRWEKRESGEGDWGTESLTRDALSRDPAAFFGQGEALAP
jgi:hypothetical protein